MVNSKTKTVNKKEEKWAKVIWTSRSPNKSYIFHSEMILLNSLQIFIASKKKD